MTTTTVAADTAAEADIAMIMIGVIAAIVTVIVAMVALAVDMVGTEAPVAAVAGGGVHECTAEICPWILGSAKWMIFSTNLVESMTSRWVSESIVHSVRLTCGDPTPFVDLLA